MSLRLDGALVFVVEVHRDNFDSAEVVVVQRLAELLRPQALLRAAHALKHPLFALIKIPG